MKRILQIVSLAIFCGIIIGIPVARANLGGAFSGGGLTSTIANGLYCQLVGCTMTGQLIIPHGNGTSAGIAFDDDATIGLFKPNSSRIDIGKSGTTRIDIDTNSNVITTVGAWVFAGSAVDITTNPNEDFTISPNGTGTLDIQKHFKGANAQASSNSGSGTCTSVTVTGTDIRGKIVATCTAGQTVIMNFGASFGGAPSCIISPDNAAADAVGSGAPFVTTSTTQMTLTVPTAATTGNWFYHCIE